MQTESLGWKMELRNSPRIQGRGEGTGGEAGENERKVERMEAGSRHSNISPSGDSEGGTKKIQKTNSKTF